MAKKSILEKLGLIEVVEEKNDLPKEEAVASSGIINSEVVKEESIKEEIKMEETKIEVVETPVKPEPVIVKQDTNDIEEKLDVLIESIEKNKFLSIDDIYRTKNLDKDTKQTVFIAEVFMKALPENLPIDIKKKSTLNIIEASGLKKENLLNDAYIRIDALNTVLEETVNKTAEIKQKNEVSIKELEERIEMLKHNLIVRNEFEEKQTASIEYEIQRIINIVDGIK